MICRLVTEKTTIPVPKIHACKLSDSSEPLSSFVILENIDTDKLTYKQLEALSDDQRQRFYTSLADIYIQLRRLEFPSIGCLALGPDGIKVQKKTSTIDINMQELEGLQPSKIRNLFYSTEGVLRSANDYVAMLLEISDNAFVRSRNRSLDQEHGEDARYHNHMFRQYVQGWMDCHLDQGPFVVVHGDFELFSLMVN